MRNLAWPLSAAALLLAAIGVAITKPAVANPLRSSPILVISSAGTGGLMDIAARDYAAAFATELGQE